MIGSTKSVWLLLVLLHSACARFPLEPRFYGQDSAVIVDIDKQFPNRLHPKLQNALYYNIPVYRLIKPNSAGGSNTSTSTSTSTTTPAPEQYPSDLMNIARHKLGIKQIDELPSLSEMGELLGTGSVSDTIKSIRTLTANEQGIALLKAYLESFNDAHGETDANNEDDLPVESDVDIDSDDDNATDNTAIDVNYDDVAPNKQPKVPSTTTTRMPEADNSFLQRVGDYLKQYDLWADESTVAPTAPAPPVVPFKPVFVSPVPPPPLAAAAVPTSTPVRPMLMRQPLPYHFPIPLRPIILAQPVKPIASPSTTTQPPAPHLNSPKHKENTTAAVAPHVQQIAEIANISPEVLDRFLQQQPKLAELAKRVSRLPLVQQHSRAIDTQLFAAVQRALSQDDELKRLLSASPTLK